MAIAAVLIQLAAPDLAVLVLVAWRCLLRTGELLGWVGGDIVFDDRLRTAVLDLGLMKGGVRRGARGSVTVFLP